MLPTPSTVDELVLPVQLRKDGVEIRTFSTIMTLGTPQDVTLQELRIESFFPMDEATAALLRSWARESTRTPERARAPAAQPSTS